MPSFNIAHARSPRQLRNHLLHLRRQRPITRANHARGGHVRVRTPFYRSPHHRTALRGHSLRPVRRFFGGQVIVHGRLWVAHLEPTIPDVVVWGVAHGCCDGLVPRHDEGGAVE